LQVRDHVRYVETDTERWQTKISTSDVWEMSDKKMRKKSNVIKYVNKSRIEYCSEFSESKILKEQREHLSAQKSDEMKVRQKCVTSSLECAAAAADRVEWVKQENTKKRKEVMFLTHERENKTKENKDDKDCDRSREDNSDLYSFRWLRCDEC